MRILLADPNSEVLAALRLILEQEDLCRKPDPAQPQDLQVVGEARDAISLFAQAARCCPEVILLDTDLPELLPRRQPGKASSGAISPLAELIGTIHLLCPAVHVIALSSRPNAEKACLQAQADAFICKSDPPDDLIALLRSFI